MGALFLAHRLNRSRLELDLARGPFGLGTTILAWRERRSKGLWGQADLGQKWYP